MPKMKSHRGAKKRLRVTGGGKVVRMRAGRRHLMYGKNASRRRRLRIDQELSPGDTRRVRALLPYD
jgi:large subunit ribosomal protein L35